MATTNPLTQDLAAMRRDYLRSGLDEAEADPDPFRQFARWFEQVRAVEPGEANAMTLATVSPDGIPAARIVLMKGFDERGFVFFSNYESAKGRDLAANPKAALLFYWPSLERQVRITGDAEPLSREASVAYFRQRPRGSQIAAAISRQSQVVPDRAALESAVARLEQELGDGEVPVPDRWGGFLVVAKAFEFWQGRPNRLHDRLRYTPRPDGTWQIDRLAP